MPSHNDVLLAKGFKTRTLTDNIVRVYSSATDAQKINGRNWYVNAESHIDRLAPFAGSREHAAAVVSHLSPRNRWENNLLAAYDLILKGECKNVIGRSIGMAKKALDSNDPLSTINGPKCQRFAQNLLGDTKPVTVDVWAMRVALGTEISLTKNLYDAIERAYQLAAVRVGEEPSHIQSITWLVKRGSK